jgi:TfoX/Sxy family transcriptional regulator of competence genes
VYGRAVAYDEGLADRIRDVISAREGVTERRMFGGIAWMVNGNMAAGVMGDDLMVRLEKDDLQQALGEPGARPFEMKGKPTAGFLIVSSEVLGTEAELARWVDCGADFAASLPPK